MANVLNIDKLQRNLEHLSNLDLTQALNKACVLVENEAKMLAPVDDGQLRRSITHEVKDNKGYVGTNVEYAPYVEYGTGLFAAGGNGRQDRWSYQDDEGEWHSTIGQKPQPFLEPALEANREKIEKLIVRETRKQVKGAFK